MAELGTFSCDCFIGKMRKGLKIRQCEEKGGGVKQLLRRTG